MFQLVLALSQAEKNPQRVWIDPDEDDSYCVKKMYRGWPAAMEKIHRGGCLCGNPIISVLSWLMGKVFLFSFPLPLTTILSPYSSIFCFQNSSEVTFTTRVDICHQLSNTLIFLFVNYSQHSDDSKLSDERCGKNWC